MDRRHPGPKAVLEYARRAAHRQPSGEAARVFSSGRLRLLAPPVEAPCFSRGKSGLQSSGKRRSLLHWALAPEPPWPALKREIEEDLSLGAREALLPPHKMRGLPPKKAGP